MLDIIVQEDSGLVGMLILLGLECFVNVILMTVMFVDLTLVGLSKLHLFNGYMADNHLLACFCVMRGEIGDLRDAFLSRHGPRR